MLFVSTVRLKSKLSIEHITELLQSRFQKVGTLCKTYIKPKCNHSQLNCVCWWFQCSRAWQLLHTAGVCKEWQLPCWSAVAVTRACPHRQCFCCRLLQPALYLSTWSLPLVMVNNDDRVIFLYSRSKREGGGRERRKNRQRKPTREMLPFTWWFVCSYSI